jgi:hypothetical protein
MTVFALAALAAYARYERIGSRRCEPPTPTAADQPATKNTEARRQPSRHAWVWAIAALFFGALAFGAYEQAVMLPACALGVAITLRLRGYRVRWAWQIGFWGLLVAYLLARRTFVPPGTSQYQLQQYRHSLDVMYTLLDYLFPANRDLLALGGQLEFGIAGILLNQAGIVARLGSNVLAYTAAIWNRMKSKGLNADPLSIPLLSTYLLSFFAFLPMAWLKHFPQYNHYHFWAMGFRAAFAAACIGLTGKLFIRAISRRELQAPPRPVPAPGSLLHP